MKLYRVKPGHQHEEWIALNDDFTCQWCEQIVAYTEGSESNFDYHVVVPLTEEESLLWELSNQEPITFDRHSGGRVS